jgi:F-type H+-transporting ATPase subunit b
MFMPHFNDTVFIAKLVDFAIFLGIIGWVYARYLRPALVAHQEAQNRAVEDAKAYHARCEAELQAARAAIEQAKVDAARMVEVAGQQAAHLIEAERAAAREHAARILAHAAGELERERYRVRRELLAETVEQAHARAREIARREIDATRQRELVERLIADLEASRA